VAPGVLAALGRDSLLLWTVAGNTARAVPVETAESADFLAFSPDGSHLFSGHDNQVTVRDTRTGRILARITHEPGIDALRSGPTGEYFATLASGQVRVWDARTGQSIAEIGGAYIHDMRFTSDGRWLATADGDGAVALRVWRGEDLLREACARLGAPMDSTEWRTWLGDEPYRPACAAPGR
jgi:WD40 repeat protein